MIDKAKRKRVTTEAIERVHIDTEGDPLACEKSPTSQHEWESDTIGIGCVWCKCDHDPAVHGDVEDDSEAGEVDDELLPQRRWAKAAGEIETAFQHKQTAEHRFRAGRFLRKIAGLLDDIESGRLSIDGLRAKEAI